MKKFTLRILGPSTTWTEIVEAERFETLNLHYSFVIGKEVVCCYPINRTIIEKIEQI